MDRESAKKEGIRHANVAIGQGAEFGTIETTIQAYRENLMDTLNDAGLAEWLSVALESFDRQIKEGN